MYEAPPSYGSMWSQENDMRRIVVTGFGAVSPIGHNAESSWRAALEGQSGIGPITQFDITDFPVSIAAEVKNFDPTVAVPYKEVRRQDRFEQLAEVAAKEAIEHAGLAAPDGAADRIGVIVSSASGGFISFLEETATMRDQGIRRVSPFTIPKVMANGASGLISIRYGFRGPALCVASACASGADGIGVALQFLRAGAVDVMVAGGAEASIHTIGIGSFDRVQAYSHKTDNTPSPFSRDRDGLIMGEGAGVLILETLEHARARGADIYAELAGYAATADAHHITAPTEDGSGSGNAIRKALEDACVRPEEVDYVNAHGTGTPRNDASETLAIKYGLGEHAYRVPISSTKSMTGHMMGATGALEAVFCVQAMRDGAIPPTINYHEPDPECDLDYVPNEARELRVRTAISNAFGFGGHNSVLVLKAFEG